MHLNHLNLCVDNLAEARSFFEDLFEFQLLDQKGEAIAVLDDGAGFTLVLADAGRFGSETPCYPAGFHVGFILDNQEQVDRIFARLAAANIQPPKHPAVLHGSYSFYFRARGDILFEVACPHQQALQ